MFSDTFGGTPCSDTPYSRLNFKPQALSGGPYIGIQKKIPVFEVYNSEQFRDIQSSKKQI